MPIYEYACMECESHFEELVRASDEAPSCPECGASKVLKQLSVFATHGPPRELPSFRGSSGGGCCGGSCGCSH
jgi:putative FmdB family regulatory protein